MTISLDDVLLERRRMIDVWLPMTIIPAAYAAKEEAMIYPTRTIEVFPRDNEHVKRLKDPTSATLFHLEAFLPFTEAVKLEKGNANLRPPSERKKPFQDMVATVQDEPSSFHKKNRGITYLCERFEYDNAKKRLQVNIPDVPEPDPGTNGEDDPRFGIADGGHTFEVIRQTVSRMNELKEDPTWTEPFVRVHFLAGEAVVSGEIELIVEALNTSSQVQQYTLDEYQNKFDDLKKALSDTGFDTGLVAFRERPNPPVEFGSPGTPRSRELRTNTQESYNDGRVGGNGQRGCSLFRASGSRRHRGSLTVRNRGPKLTTMGLFVPLLPLVR